MSSVAAALRQQSGGSMEQWENVPAGSLEKPVHTNTSNTDLEETCKAQTWVLYIKVYHICSVNEACMHNI